MPGNPLGGFHTYVLPSTKDLPAGERIRITLDPFITAGELDQGKPIDQAIDSALTPETLLRHIRGWNLQDEDGGPLPITEHNLNQLPFQDCRYLISKLGFNKWSTDRDDLKLISYLDNLAEGKKSGWNPPLSFLLYQYRTRFNISYPEMAATPLSVILQDLKYRDIESQVSAKHQKNP